MAITVHKYSKMYHFFLEGGAGLSPTLFPADDATHYVRSGYVHDIGGGNYIIEVNPYEDTDGGYLISKVYDLYYSGSKKDEGENIDLGWWDIITEEYTLDQDNKAINFNDLTEHDSGKTLPAYIPGAQVGVFAITSDASGVRIHSGIVTTSGFTASRIPGWGDPNVKVQFLIRGG